VFVYKNGAYTDEDFVSFASWFHDMTRFEAYGRVNPHSLTLVHVPPDSALPQLTYAPYFEDSKNPALAGLNTDTITDDKPFRHLITPLPFPPSYYAIFLVFAALMILALGWHHARKENEIHPRVLILSAFLGILTFGLQYLLFYKTAAFLYTDLIFFSVFLIIPLFFSSLGGFVATKLSTRHLLYLTIVFLMLAYFLTTTDIFANELSIVFGTVAFLFFYAGFLFTLLLDRIVDVRTRQVAYGVNLFAGGLAFLIMITLHATIGWVITFALVTAALTLCMMLFIRTSRLEIKQDE